MKHSGRTIRLAPALEASRTFKRARERLEALSAPGRYVRKRKGERSEWSEYRYVTCLSLVALELASTVSSEGLPYLLQQYQ